jgi:hypothetical protein
MPWRCKPRVTSAQMGPHEVDLSRTAKKEKKKKDKEVKCLLFWESLNKCLRLTDASKKS